MEESVQEKKGSKKLTIAITVILLIVIGSVGFVYEHKVAEERAKEEKYNNALLMMSLSSYDESIQLFTELGDYKDSADKVKEANYNKAADFMSEGKYDNAIEVFTKLGSYSDSSHQIEVCKAAKELVANTEKYNQAVAYFNNGNLRSARKLFEELGDFEDAPEKVFRTLSQGDTYEYNGTKWAVLNTWKDNPRYILIMSKSTLEDSFQVESTKKWIENSSESYLKSFPDKFQNSVLYCSSNPAIGIQPKGHTNDYPNVYFRVFLMEHYKENLYKDSYSAMKYNLSGSSYYVAMWIDVSRL